MCGIVGILGRLDVVPLLVAGLKRLEYRGYDSAGVATLVDGKLVRRRAAGKLSALEDKLVAEPLHGTTGIGHTRWATHGPATEPNAHPHIVGRVAIIHNGIIENHRELRDELIAKGRVFESETDTEVVAHLLDQLIIEGATPEEAMRRTMPRLTGAFAFCVLFAGEPDLMIGARRGSPLALGHGDGEMYLGSDAIALAPLTRRITYLDEGDWCVVSRAGARVFDAAGQPVNRPITLSEITGALIGKGNYRHFMAKEIHEQPEVIGYTLHGLMDSSGTRVQLPDLPFDLDRIDRVTLIACGTSFHAALIAKFWIERFARVTADVDVASEFRYRQPPLTGNGLSIFISQSGETIDTLAALHYVKKQGGHTLALVNMAESAMARDAGAFLRTRAGPEICVASTKAFTTQLVALACFAIALARAKGTIDATEEARLLRGLGELPRLINEALRMEDEAHRLGEMLSHARDVLYLGRGLSYPIALEGALKLKELSYIHAEGYAAGEMKHGPIALIDERSEERRGGTGVS
jgi:glucosamine--fructose-6-phosphate aminotransferase (isomerizing)